MTSKAVVDKRPVSDRRPLIDVVASVREAEREAKRERARAMDALTDLLLERAEARHLLTQARWFVGVDLGDKIDRHLGKE